MFLVFLGSVPHRSGATCALPVFLLLLFEEDGGELDVGPVLDVVDLVGLIDGIGSTHASVSWRDNGAAGVARRWFFKWRRSCFFMGDECVLSFPVSVFHKKTDTNGPRLRTSL